MSEPESLGKVEFEVLQAVAKLQPVSVRALVEHFADTSGQARTTILTVLERLRHKKFLTRKKIGGVYHYSPRVSVPTVLQQLVGDFVERILGGSVSPFVAYLQDTKSLDADEVAQLRALVQDLEAKQSARKERS